MNVNVLLLGLLAVAVGALYPIQPAVNALLGRGIGGAVAASIVSFSTGLFVLLCLNAALFRQWPRPADLAAQPASALWLGGAVGAVFLSANVFLAPRLGSAATLACVIAGQVGSALAIDRFGLFGIPVRELSAGRVGGAALVLAGALLVRLT